MTPPLPTGKINSMKLEQMEQEDIVNKEVHMLEKIEKEKLNLIK